MTTSEMLRYNDEALKNKETSTIMHSVLSSAITELQLCVTNSAMDGHVTSVHSVMCAFPMKKYMYIVGIWAFLTSFRHISEANCGVRQD